MPRILAADQFVYPEPRARERLPCRRREPKLEEQERRCPRCNRIMVILMGRLLPEYQCACAGDGQEWRWR
jgi:hypothetical protein